jgi:hypothetical protein
MTFYVDLNPVRAKIADTPEASKHTSFQQRLGSLKQIMTQPLKPFIGNPKQDMPQSIAFSLKDYSELVDMTRRIFRSDKAGHIDHQQQSISQKLCLSDEQWLTLTTEFENTFAAPLEEK